MIFAVWYLSWISLSDSLLHLVLPAMAFIVRSSYIDKNIPSIRPEWIALWILIAAMSGLIPGKGMTFSSVFFVKLALGALLIFHLQSTLKTARIKTIPWINQIWFFMSRAFLILRKRFNDIDIWRKVRIRDVKRRHKGNPKYANQMGLISLVVTLIVVGVLLWLVNNYIPMDGQIKRLLNAVVVIFTVIWLLIAFGVCFIAFGPLYLKIAKIYWRSSLALLIEILFIQNRLVTVVTARGGFPDNSNWMQQIDPPNSWRFTALADTMLIGAMLAPLFAGASSLVPFPLLKQIESLI
jgi:hypothetical protein